MHLACNLLISIMHDQHEQYIRYGVLKTCFMSPLTRWAINFWSLPSSFGIINKVLYGIFADNCFPWYFSMTSISSPSIPFRSRPSCMMRCQLLSTCNVWTTPFHCCFGDVLKEFQSVGNALCHNTKMLQWLLTTLHLATCNWVLPVQFCWSFWNAAKTWGFSQLLPCALGSDTLSWTPSLWAYRQPWHRWSAHLPQSHLQNKKPCRNSLQLLYCTSSGSLTGSCGRGKNFEHGAQTSYVGFEHWEHGWRR